MSISQACWLIVIVLLFAVQALIEFKTVLFDGA